MMLLYKLSKPVVSVAVVVALLVGCEQDAPKPTGAATTAKPAPKRTEPTAKTPSPHADAGGSSATGDGGASKLRLDGLTFTVPDGWKPAPVGSGMFVAKAAFTLPGADGDAKGVSVRITHYPEQKGKDELNIARWLSQVRRPDGSAYTKEQANAKITEAGNIRLTVVDLEGSITRSMMGGGTGTPNQRMIAAIVDHPKGPHIVKVVGGKASVARWEASIQAFLHSAVVN